MAMSVDRKEHWDTVYGKTPETSLSWHQDDPTVSLDLIRMAGISRGASVIDIGGGMSRFTDAVLAMGLRDVTILDLSQMALDAARDRLGPAGGSLTWLCKDITTWSPTRQYDLWHDRAVFHFLTDPADRAAYIESLTRAVRIDGHAIIATFAPDGPDRCSGLPVVRYSPENIAVLLADSFAPVAHRRHLHQTPKGAEQAFQFSLIRRVG